MRIRKQWIEFMEQAIEEMHYRSPLYRMLKRKLTERGNWKDRPRGKPNQQHFTTEARRK